MPHRDVDVKPDDYCSMGGRGTVSNLMSQEIIKLLDILIGPVEATGDVNVDDEINENLMTLIDVTNYCLDGVMFASETRHSLEDSKRRVGERAFSAMAEWNEWLSEQVDG